MSPLRWQVSVADAPDSEPYAVVGDLVLAVRTPRARDFVTVEVAPAARHDGRRTRDGGVVLSPKPSPWLADQWCGEVHTGDTVGFEVGGESYRLTLARLADSPAGFPWVTCDFSLERD
jgi:hypothetical protein